MDLRKPIKFKFQIRCIDTKWGESLFLLGDNESLGNWNSQKAVRMNTDKTIFPLWTSNKIDLIPKKNTLEYKYLIMNESGRVVRWEEFQNNRKLDFNELPVNYAKEDILDIELKDASFGKNPLNNNSYKVDVNISKINKSLRENIPHEDQDKIGEISDNLNYKVNNETPEELFMKKYGKKMSDKNMIDINGSKNSKINDSASNEIKVESSNIQTINEIKVESNNIQTINATNNNNQENEIISTSLSTTNETRKPPLSLTSSTELNEKFTFNSSTYKKNLKKLIDGNSKARTWKEKLELVNSMITNDLFVTSKDSQTNNANEASKPKQNLDAASLSMLSVFLFFLNSGQIKCAEDGTHFRPNHHANLAFSIFSFLLKNLDDSNSVVIRAILRNIPSFSDHYLSSVPMTRIRDIAHRNDIPQDLKQEIKNKLQNKLHRSASPDDLKTCEYLIEKIKNGNYSQDFKKEFFIFYDELKEFFNALGVEKSLNRLKETYNNSNSTQKINDFLTLKSQIDLGNKAEKYEKFLNLLYSTTNLRSEINLILTQEIGKIGTNQQVNKTLLQLASTCDVELENYVFSTLSSFINILDENLNRSSKNALTEYYEKLYFDLSKICLKNLTISNIYIDETKFLEEDLECFLLNKNKYFSREGKLLRIKAVFERCLSLCYNLNNLILDCFTQSSNDVGNSLSINNESIKVYGEAFIRNHTVFQFSKIVSLVLDQIRQELNLSPYVIISSGVRKGILIHCKTLRDLEVLIDSKFKNNNKISLTAFLDEADGSEELPTQVKNLFLGHDLPQLSHLAIRARQNKSVFIAVVDKQVYEGLLNKYFGKTDNYSNINFNDFSKHVIVNGKSEVSVNIENSNNNYDDFLDLEEGEFEDKIEKSRGNMDANVNLNNLSMDVSMSKKKESLDSIHKNSLLERDESKNLSLLDIEDADYSNCGSKSTNIKKLLKVKSIVETNKDFIFGNNKINDKGVKNSSNVIDFKIPYSLCIPFGIYEFYSRILINHSDHPNSEYSMNYDLIDYDELINLEKNSLLFRDKFVEHFENYHKYQKEDNASLSSTSNPSPIKLSDSQKEITNKERQAKEKINTAKYFENLIRNIIEKTTENIKLKNNKNTDSHNNQSDPILLAFRSSSNLEDLNKNAGAGLFDSILGVPNNKPDMIKKAILDVWSSLFTYRALLTRRKMGILSKFAKMAILVQEMIHSEFSFIIHTCNPVTKNKDEVFIEMAIGLGETLASANQKGSPYRLIYSKKNDQVKIVNFSSFAFAYCVDIEEKLSEKENKDANTTPKIRNINKRICYKYEKLSNDENFIKNVGTVLGRIGVIIEQNLNKDKEEDKKEAEIIPQDIEGAYANESVYIVQTRPQII